MPTCHSCGEEIEIRYYGGKLIPFHVSGSFCSGSSGGKSSAPTAKPFQKVGSYINPNARCLVCGDQVFYYQSPYGGRVFFNDVGWPWDKHPCTDDPNSQNVQVKRIYSSRSSNTEFKSRDGERLDLYEIASLKEDETNIVLRFGRIGDYRSFQVMTTISELAKTWDITMQDLRRAPSFAVRIQGDYRIISFISDRKKAIDQMVFRRPVSGRPYAMNSPATKNRLSK